MDKVTYHDLREMLALANKATSPGRFALGIDLLQLAVDPARTMRVRTVPGVKPTPIARALCAFCPACLRVGSYPSILMEAWITAVPKDPVDRTKVRPVSVLPELAKFVSRVLALRIRKVLIKHPDIIAAGQRAGLANGDFNQAVDVVLDCLEDSLMDRAEGNRPQGNITLEFFDQAKAFDCVLPEVLRRTLQAAGLPKAFQDLVCSGILQATARVRTYYGLSHPVKLRRGLRQGDPLATLLYVFFINPLHLRLEELAQEHGYRLRGATNLAITSGGFVDDVVVISRSLRGAAALHRVLLNLTVPRAPP